jgi:hypothetical protein
MSLKYEIRPRKDRRGVDLISEKLPYAALWYGEPNAVENAAWYAQFNAGSEAAIISILDESGVIVDTRNYTPVEGRGANTLGRL